MSGWSYKRRRSHNADGHRQYLITKKIETEICKQLAVFMDLAALYGMDRAMEIWDRRNAEIQRRRSA